eukprot:402976_1
MRFQSVYHNGAYLGVLLNFVPYRVVTRTDSLGTMAEWLPSQISDGTMLESTKSGAGCLHIPMGSWFETDPSCTQSSGKSRKFRIVPRFPCYQNSYFDNIAGWYSGLSADLSAGAWQNMMNTGNDITLTTGSLQKRTQGSTGLPYVRGYVADIIEFPPVLATSDYTAMFLTRYQTTNQARIIECKQSGCAVGHRRGDKG